jgi:hypothetical protein
MATKLCNIDPEEYFNIQKAHKFIKIFIWLLQTLIRKLGIVGSSNNLFIYLSLFQKRVMRPQVMSFCPFLLVIVLSVLLRFTDSDYHFGIFKFFLIPTFLF